MLQIFEDSVLPSLFSSLAVAVARFKSEYIIAFAGFLTTCGLDSICTPSDDTDGFGNIETLGQHGRISNTPADNFYSVANEESGEPVIETYAHMTQGRLFGDRLSLTRRIKVFTDRNVFEISDTVKNFGYVTSPHMILYHINFGYPFLTEEAKIILPAEKTVPRNAYAAKDADKWDQFTSPQSGIEEQCYYHTLKKDADGWTGYSLNNPALGFGINVRYDANPLDYFIEWKNPGEGDYVLGLEPGNCNGEGRKKAREDGILKYLQPGEEVKYRFVIEITDL
ncbi:DUF4432 domain-containing protein [Clostridia bacterium]|nr:DUF4432 domain-containing protein [Clostridia bacterium]